MKVIALNGSPKKEGNTAYAVSLVAEELNDQGIDVEVFHIGGEAIRGCTACGVCKSGNPCPFSSAQELSWMRRIYQADGLIVGSPVYYASANGTVKSFMDKLFYGSGGAMRHKVGASLTVARRGGCLTAFNELNQYFLISEMIIPGSCYWNIIYGSKPGEAEQDLEGIRIMRTLGRNMGWVLRAMAAGAAAEAAPEPLPKVSTNFIR